MMCKYFDLFSLVIMVIIIAYGFVLIPIEVIIPNPTIKVVIEEEEITIPYGEIFILVSDLSENLTISIKGIVIHLCPYCDLGTVSSFLVHIKFGDNSWSIQNIPSWKNHLMYNFYYKQLSSFKKFYTRRINPIHATSILITVGL